MHYCIYVFTKEEPTEEEIEKIMEPYAEPEAPNFAPISWDWYSIGGRFWKRLTTKSGFKCDGAPVMDVINNIDLVGGCYAFITPGGVIVPSELWIWDRIVINPDFDEQFQKVIKENSDGYITVLDIHS